MIYHGLLEEGGSKTCINYITAITVPIIKKTNHKTNSQKPISVYTGFFTGIYSEVFPDSIWSSYPSSADFLVLICWELAIEFYNSSVLLLLL